MRARRPPLADRLHAAAEEMAKARDDWRRILGQGVLWDGQTKLIALLREAERKIRKGGE